MGGGGLRILGHKKWHVWRRENIERVLKDEREHEEKQRGDQIEQTERDQEQRARVLSNQQQHYDDEASHSTHAHINFFQREEEAHTKALLEGSGDANDRAKKRQRANETLGRHAQLPWYASNDAHGKPDDEAKSRKRKRALERHDPMLTMRPQRDPDDQEDEEKEDERVRQRLHAAKECPRQRRHQESRGGGGGSSSSSTSGESDRGSESQTGKRLRSTRKKEKQTKSKKTKKSKKHKRERDGREQIPVQLRREREEREALERVRIERLMRGH